MRARLSASRGFLKISPIAGARPSGRNVRAAAGSWASRSAAACHSAAINSATGKPSRANPIAGASACAIEMVPKRVSSASQPLTTPGTSTDNGPSPGISVRPRRAYSCGVAAAAERPLASSP